MNICWMMRDVPKISFPHRKPNHAYLLLLQCKPESELYKLRTIFEILHHRFELCKNPYTCLGKYPELRLVHNMVHDCVRLEDKIWNIEENPSVCKVVNLIMSWNLYISQVLNSPAMHSTILEKSSSHSDGCSPVVPSKMFEISQKPMHLFETYKIAKTYFWFVYKVI